MQPENSAMHFEDELGSIWTTEETQNLDNSLDQKYWKEVFIASCLCALFVDPLFLYVPILKDDIKCLMLDPKLKIVVLLLRSVTDFFYLMDIIIRIYRSKNFSDLIAQLESGQQRMNFKFVLKYCVPTIAKAIWASNDILIDTVALLPLPQVFGAVWYFFAIQQMMMCWHSACQKDDGCDNRIFGCHDHHAFRHTTTLNDLCPLNSSDTSLFDFGIFGTVLQYGIVGSTDYFQKFFNCFWWGLRNLSSFGSNLEPSVDGWENLYTVFISITGLLLFLYLIGNLQVYMQFATTTTEDQKHRRQMRRKRKERGKEIELLLFKNGTPTRLKDKKLRIMKKVQQGLEQYIDTNLDDILPLLPSDLQSYIKDAKSLAWLKQVPKLRGMDEVVLKKIYDHLEPMRYTENSEIIQKDQPLDKMLLIVDGELCDSDDSKRGAGELCGEELLRWPFSTFFPNTKPLATKSVKAVGAVEALILKACDLESIYNQPDIERGAQDHKRKTKDETKQRIEQWMSENEIPESLNNYIMPRMMEKVEQGKIVYWDIPLDLENEIESCIPLTKWKEEKMLHGMDEVVLKRIYQQLEHMSYNDKSDILQKDKQLEKMLFIVDGLVNIEKKSYDSDDSKRGAGELCGEELLRWPFYSSFPDTKPLATESVKAIGVVETFVLKASDLESIYEQSVKMIEEPRHRRMMKEEIEQNIDGLIPRNGIPAVQNQDVKSGIMQKVEEQFQEGKAVYWDTLPFDWDNLVSLLSSEHQDKIKSYKPLTKLKKIPTFQNMEDSVLKEICRHLRPMKYNREENIIKKGDPIQMILIVAGSIAHQGRVKCGGDFCGEELLDWPFSTSFPDRVPTAAESLYARNDGVEALVLTANDMKSVATEFRKHFIKKYE